MNINRIYFTLSDVIGTNPPSRYINLPRKYAILVDSLLDSLTMVFICCICSLILANFFMVYILITARYSQVRNFTGTYLACIPISS